MEGLAGRRLPVNCSHRPRLRPIDRVKLNQSAFRSICSHAASVVPDPLEGIGHNVSAFVGVAEAISHQGDRLHGGVIGAARSRSNCRSQILHFISSWEHSPPMNLLRLLITYYRLLWTYLMTTTNVISGDSFISTIRRRRSLMSASEVAEVLRVSPKTIYRMAKESRIPNLRIGYTVRFDPEIIARWLDEKTVVTHKFR
jgi:excisionase family DNA binding protein